MMPQQTDILIIGAGPSGSSAACLLRQKGYQVTLIEQQYFPRFTIGESLLPQSMVILAEAGVLDLLQAQAAASHFQLKNGAAFMRGEQSNAYVFSDKLSVGPDSTWQVRRDVFDQLLAQAAAEQGVDLRFGHRLVAADFSRSQPCLEVCDAQGQVYQIQARFVLDASGFGRVLPKLLDLDLASNLPPRQALFTHIEDHLNDSSATDLGFDRHKILISVHAKHPQTWYWTIPFADGRSSFGIVSEPEFFARYQCSDVNQNSNAALMQRILADDVALSGLLKQAVFDRPVHQLMGYSANVKQLFGRNFALLGNAGEFLDPVFSSGVTIALKSSSMACSLVDQVLQGQSVDWLTQYERPLRKGIAVFKAFVESWYQGDFQDVVFAQQQNPEVRRMLSAILAGYVWDEHNPMNHDSQRRLQALAEYCRLQQQQATEL
jgi:flavin-dependent dehydrogenase